MAKGIYPVIYPPVMSLAEYGRNLLAQGTLPLASLLFGNGEDGFLFGNFAELDEMFTTSVGPANVAANDDPAGLSLDDHSWGGLTLAQVTAAATELRGNGVVGLLGAATAATYNTGTGAGSVTRVDANNQSYVSIPVTNGKTYVLNITATNAVAVRNVPSGAVAYAYTAGQTATVYVVGVSNAIVITYSGVSGTGTFALNSIKEVPGNHIVQATAANRPLWTANAGKPYLATDGSNDILVSPFLPGAAVTMAAACRITVGATFIMGGGESTPGRRCFLGLEGNGKIASGWGTLSTNIITAPAGDIRGQDHVLLMTADASTVDLWLDGVLAYTGASTGTAATTTSPIGLGALWNAGVAQNWVSGRLSAAVALNRRVTLAEISRINADFQRTF